MHAKCDYEVFFYISISRLFGIRVNVLIKSTNVSVAFDKKERKRKEKNRKVTTKFNYVLVNSNSTYKINKNYAFHFQGVDTFFD